MKQDIVQIAKDVFEVEAQGILSLQRTLGDGEFAKAIELLLTTQGRVVVTGMGKSGIIGRKIASTLASTGTRSLFLHPAEAYHGDLGMIDRADIVIGISYSGETEEVVRLIPFLTDRSIPLVAITGNPRSTMARHAAVHLDASVAREACPLQLAPTTSTTAALALGDAIAVVLMRERDFRPEDFAEYHPGGSLGRRLLTRVQDVMRTENLPRVARDASLADMLQSVSAGRLGTCLISDGEQTLGIVTDGDLRRVLETRGKESFDLVAEEIMTRNPTAIAGDERLENAIQIMNDRNITVLLVEDADAVVGVLHLFDCGL
jgi:arabinose-5-phosphate isomerase